MKLRKNRRTYKLPKAIGKFLHAHLDETKRGGYYTVMHAFPFTEVLGAKARPGKPSQLGISEDGKQITVWPVPDGTYELLIRYFPPVEEM